MVDFSEAMRTALDSVENTDPLFFMSDECTEKVLALLPPGTDSRLARELVLVVLDFIRELDYEIVPAGRDGVGEGLLKTRTRYV
jgi:hypothetical protein